MGVAVGSLVVSVASNLLATLQNKEVREFISIFGYKSDLEDLQRTVTFIQGVFQDAEKKQTLSVVELHLLQDLKDAVYEADDLLDEFVTLVDQKKLFKTDGSISKRLRCFVARTNPFGVAYRMSKGVKKIRKKLDAIVDNKRFSFVHNPEPIRNRRPETCSYVNEVEIIGREKDLEEIVGVLLDLNVQRDLSFLSIVGIGGIGKTALAQLVFNDKRVIRAFPLRLWTCISDQNQKQFDVKEVLCKILAAATRSTYNENYTLDQVQGLLQQQLAKKRYLFFLDDVWTENREDWYGLTRSFVGGQRRSWIVVTTRSQETAKIIGGKASPVHELQGLSESDSWRLFKRIAFDSEESNPPDDDLNELGREIVDGCAQVPLAIRVVGSLLYCQDKSKWQSVKEIGLANIRKSEDGIMSVLQLSYNHLESPLKSCFKYCALFPKDFKMDKEMLINLWIAQGYVVPFYVGQSIENASEEYFSILLKRCLFQDIERNELGEIMSCKMHDLIHDVAQSVSEKEIYATNICSEDINEKVHHFSFREYWKHSLGTNHIRSCIHVSDSLCIGGEMENSFVEELISSCKYLRALKLIGLEMKSLPYSMHTLLHLRFLDLSYNSNLKVLPKSISKLHNLQTLILVRCNSLRELAPNLSKLVKLKVLDITDCWKLIYMPRDMAKLSCLYRLSDFIAGSEGSFVSWKQWFNGLQDLKALNSLKGKLSVQIKWPKNVDNVITGSYIEQGSILKSKAHLNSILIYFEHEGGGIMNDEGGRALMTNLQPHPSLMKLEIVNYFGTRMPDWASLLPNLVELNLGYCMHLKEWIETSSSGNIEVELESQPCLPELKSLKVENCPKLTWIPLCPKLELLHLEQFNREMVFRNVGHNLKEIKIDNVKWLNSLPMESFQCLEKLIFSDEKVEKLREVGEVFYRCSSSLQRLEIKWGDNLTSVVDGGLEHLTALEELTFYNCFNLKLSEEEEIGGFMPSTSLLPSLRTLTFHYLPNLENLPNWMQYFSALQTLEIIDCENLKSMPSWMPQLTSLRHLEVQCCSKILERRCQKGPQGEDWPFIQHIPSIEFVQSYYE